MVWGEFLKENKMGGDSKNLSSVTFKLTIHMSYCMFCYYEASFLKLIVASMWIVTNRDFVRVISVPPLL